MLIGFGSTERENEEREMEAVRQFVRDNRHAAMGEYGWWNKEFVDGALSAFIKERQRYANASGDREKRERYYNFWYRIICQRDDLIVIFTFLHVNTRHPMSPDGVAAIERKAIFYLQTNEV